MTTPVHSNQLIYETSPYLLQHAHNPVDWYPWSEAALDKARKEDKPILLSIGYSACHWCHVMEHESFEDGSTAELMNELFICIKVDREERPDLDKIYQTSYQMLNQRGGGWPLNMFLTPDDHIPFFGGTFFPREARYGMPAFKDILQRIADFYRQRRDEINKQNQTLNNVYVKLEKSGNDSPSGVITPDLIIAARNELEKTFDPRFGGFGGAPKFPHPGNIDLCLHHWWATRQQGNEDGHALFMARYTLHAMASGGIYDQLGGGFCRYAVDEQWMIPHFEKMLYDNAQLLSLYTDAAVATGETTFKRVAIETAEWVLREMQGPDGGYCSSLDADSEGEEGKFYAWDIKEIEQLVDADEWKVLDRRYGLKTGPNFEGKWHLHIRKNTVDIAKELGYKESLILEKLASAHKKLFKQRETRIRPGRDDKILTSWNGLMIKGMARCGRLLDRPDFIDSAQNTLDFIRNTLYIDGRLLATYKDGKAHLMAYLDDYVFLIDAILELLQARWRNTDLEFATDLMDTVVDLFEDKGNGGFYFTADDHEKLVYRPKPTSDDAIPAGNGVAALCLLRLGHMLGESRYLDAAERTLKALLGSIMEYPTSHAALLLAIDEYLEPTETVVLRGKPETMNQWQQVLNGEYGPHRLTIAIPDTAEQLPGILEHRKPAGEITAYVCSDHSCSPPATSLEALQEQLALS